MSFCYSSVPHSNPTSCIILWKNESCMHTFYNAHLLPFFNSKCALGILMWYWYLCSSADDLFDLFSWFISLNIPSILKPRKESCSPERRVNASTQTHEVIWVLVCSEVTNIYFWLSPSFDYLGYLLQRESVFMFIYLCMSNRWHSGIQYQQPVRRPRRTTSETLALLACLSDTAKMHMPAAMQKHLTKDKHFCLNAENNCKSNWQT